MEGGWEAAVAAGRGWWTEVGAIAAKEGPLRGRGGDGMGHWGWVAVWDWFWRVGTARFVVGFGREAVCGPVGRSGAGAVDGAWAQ